MDRQDRVHKYVMSTPGSYVAVASNLSKEHSVSRIPSFLKTRTTALCGHHFKPGASTSHQLKLFS